MTLGCFLAVSCFEYPGVEGAAEFVVLVRNVVLIGAAAIALPVSLYTFWMKDRAFRVDFRRAVNEEVDRRERIEREVMEARDDVASVGQDEIHLLLEYVTANEPCMIEEIRENLKHRIVVEVDHLVIVAHSQGLIDARHRHLKAFEGDTMQFGRITSTHQGRAWLGMHRTQSKPA